MIADRKRTEENTAKGRKGAEEVCLPGNRRLCHVDIGGSSKRLGVYHIIVGLIGVIHIEDVAARRVHCVEWRSGLPRYAAGGNRTSPGQRTQTGSHGSRPRL